MIQKYTLPFSYKKDNGTWVLHLNEVTWQNEFAVKEASVITIPPQSAGGNHKHPRLEAFIALGKGLELIWEEDGVFHKESMDATDQIHIFVMPAYVPHAVKNTTDHEVSLYELASDKQHDVEVVHLV